MTENEKQRIWAKTIRATEVLRLPKHSIATFGPTNLYYYCLSSLGVSSTRIRKGTVFAERPKIITPEHFRDIFDGFMPEAREFANTLLESMGDKLRALGYNFRHELQNVEIASKALPDTWKSVNQDLGSHPLTAVVRGPDDQWQVSLMKLTLEVISTSFPMNVKELEERNLFDPEQRLKAKIEALFLRAERDAAALQELVQFLKENQVFEEYQDRFFDLVKKEK